MYKFNSNNNVVFEEVENHLSVKFGRKVKISSIQSIGGGCINHSSKIDTNIGRFFLKWNTTGPADIFIREAESLQELKKAIAENVPQETLKDNIEAFDIGLEHMKAHYATK